MTSCHFAQKAGHAYKDDGIRKGDSYYWWKFRHSGIYRSLKAPKPSQLTQSEFWSTYLAAMEMLEGLTSDMSMSDIKDVVEKVVSDLNTLADECEKKRDNMPEGLQRGPTGEMLTERADGVRDVASELEGVDLDLDGKDIEEDDRQVAIDEVQSVSEYGGE